MANEKQSIDWYVRDFYFSDQYAWGIVQFDESGRVRFQAPVSDDEAFVIQLVNKHNADVDWAYRLGNTEC